MHELNVKNVKVAAIQGNFPYPNPLYNCFSKEYCRNVDEILCGFIAPRIEKARLLLSKAGAEGCDIVTTSEDLTGTACYLTEIQDDSFFHELVAASQCMAQKMLSEVSRKYNMYIIGCYHNKISSKIYNQAVIFDRKGEILGRYSKTHIPFNEKWQVCAGNELPVFKLDFGTIGISICYEMMFPETMQVLSLKGAQIVFHPTSGYGWYDSIGEATLRTRANDNDVYLVTAKSYVQNAAGKSSIIDYWGQVLADAGFYEDVIVSHTIDLSLKKSQPEWFVPSRMSASPLMANRKKSERRPELYSEITSKDFIVNKQFSIDEKLEILNDMKSGAAHW